MYPSHRPHWPGRDDTQAATRTPQRNATAVFSAANELLVLKRSIHENLVKEKRVRSDVSAL